MSKSRSKTPKSSAARRAALPTTTPEAEAEGFEAAGFVDELRSSPAGHRPAHSLSPQDEALFRSFQNNLISLVSHELRTPLMGILNSLNLLEEEPGDAPAELDKPALISMARRNAQRLSRTLGALLDLAALESGTFHVKLREIDLEVLVRARLAAHETALRDQGIVSGMEGGSSKPSRRGEGAPLLADPQKLGRVLDLLLHAILARAERGSRVAVRVKGTRVELAFKLDSAREDAWETSWMQGLAGLQSGVASPGSAFAGTLQSEQQFLARVEEGLGSELVLAQQIIRMHQGRLDARKEGRAVVLELVLPELSSEDGLRAVLASRVELISPDQGAIGAMALALIQVPDDEELAGFRQKIQKNLFRSSDSAYVMPVKRRIALVLDDCKPDDAPRLLARITRGLGREVSTGVAACPSDGVEPGLLLELAEKRLQGA